MTLIWSLLCVRPCSKTLQMLTHLILPIALRGRYCGDLHFIGEPREMKCFAQGDRHNKEEAEAGFKPGPCGPIILSH